MEFSRTPPGAAGGAPDWDLLMEKLADLESRLDQVPSAPPNAGISDRKLAIIATSIYRARRRRSMYFEKSLFSEPAWDMLLDLFINTALGLRVSTSSLSLASDASPTTGLRYIDILEEKGLIVRWGSPVDRRVTYLELTKEGYKLMRRYLIDGLTRFEFPSPQETGSTGSS